LHTRALPRSGADKVSIGSDAVFAAEAYLAAGGAKDGSTAIEQISRVYGAQAVVVSIDPRRVYVAAPADTHHAVVETSKPGAGPGGMATACCPAGVVVAVFKWSWFSGRQGGRRGERHRARRGPPCMQAPTASATAGGSAR
jgi:hypothetical protein